MGDKPKNQEFKILFETSDFLNLAIYYIKNELNLTPKDAEMLLKDSMNVNVDSGEKHLWEEVRITIEKEIDNHGK